MSHRHYPISDRPYIQYCPRCGSRAIPRPIISRLICQDCGFELYFNAATAVIALITDELGRLLLTVRAREPQKGMLGLPGGFVDLGETAEMALAREVEEELSVGLCSARFLCTEPNIYPYKGVTYVTVDIAFVCKVDQPQLATPTDDVAQILWRQPSQVDPKDFGFESMAKVFIRFMETLKDRG